MSRTLDLPIEFIEDENAILVLDPIHSAYKPQMEHDGVVYVEKCLVRKGKYLPTPLADAKKGTLTAKADRPNAYLVKETNFQDRGGGMQTFERHYATFPTTWYDYEQVSYRTLWWGAINYRSESGGGDSWDKTRITSAKATHYYMARVDIPTIPVPEGDTVGQDYVNDLTKIYTMPPESRVGRNWEDSSNAIGLTVAIAPDTLRVYMGEIYELVRYTITL